MTLSLQLTLSDGHGKYLASTLTYFVRNIKKITATDLLGANFVVNTSTFEDIFHVLRCRKAHFRVKKSPKLGNLLSQLNTVSIRIFTFPTHFNNIPQVQPTFSKPSFPASSPTRISYRFFNLLYSWDILHASCQCSHSTRVVKEGHKLHHTV